MDNGDLSQITRILSLVHDSVFLISKDFKIIFSNALELKSNSRESVYCYKKLFNFKQPCSFCSFQNISDKEFSASLNRGKGHLVQITNQAFLDNPTENFVLNQTLIESEGSEYLMDLVHREDLNQGELNANDQLSTLGAHVQTIAHELSNPVTGLNLTYQKINEMVMKKEEVKASAIKPFLDLLSSDIMRASQIISEIRNYSKPIMKPTKIVDIKEVIETGLKNVQRLYTFLNVEVQMHWQIPDKIKIYGNSGKLEQCFINIFKNCYDMFQIRQKVSQPHILVTGEYLDVEKKIAIHIIDNAGGISNDALKKVFKPYFTTKERYRGLGLGLYITSQILKEHGGSIQMDSSGDKTKVTVTMQIPG